MNNELPANLKTLVDHAISTLGTAVKEEVGEDVLHLVESIRVRCREMRRSTTEQVVEQLNQIHQKLESVPESHQAAVAHAFALMMELINVCENAYRTFRLSTREETVFSGDRQGITYVLTAHPTEARSYESIKLFQQIQKVLLEALSSGYHRMDLKLLPLLKIAWKVPLSKRETPTVAEEAIHLYASSLNPEAMDAFVQADLNGIRVFLRTWVGGDKDGHPGVDANAMVESLQESRHFVISHIKRHLRNIQHNLRLILSGSEKHQKVAVTLLELSDMVIRDLQALRQIRPSDGEHVLSATSRIEQFCREYSRLVGSRAFSAASLETILQMFPGLVMPLELRENAQVVHEAAEGKPAAISDMLSKLREISAGGNPKWYARGLVLSMVDNSSELLAGLHLVKKCLGESPFSVMPLLEKESALRNAVEIVEGLLNDKAGKQVVEESWQGHIEIMLGYSDSAKEVGSLPSRLLILRAMQALEKVLTEQGYTPVFFQGSGGSVARGGGSVAEQLSWWPQAAIRKYKVTIQGEMVQRSFASGNIARSQIEKIAAISKELLNKKTSPASIPDELLDFAGKIQKRYVSFISMPDFESILEEVTQYRFLKELRLGSRPSKRVQGGFSLSSIRAIPWVLCWTQGRILFPAWWGVGDAWKNSSSDERKQLKKAFEELEVFSSYVKLLGFTLRKVELGVWEYLLRQSSLPKERVSELISMFETEYKHAVEFVNYLSGSSDLLWFRPWLEKSIEKRSSMIHPLNVLQLIAARNGNLPLLRECTSGIACGMLTTG